MIGVSEHQNEWHKIMMKVFLCSISAAFLVNANAGLYSALDDNTSNEINQDYSDDILVSTAEKLKLKDNNMYIYKDVDGEVLLTNVSPSGDFKKFTLRVKSKSFEEARSEFRKEEERVRQLAKKPDAKIGMSKNQVLNHTNWDKPKDIDTIIDVSGKSEK